MFVVCEYLDDQNASDARAATIDAHRVYLKSNTEMLRLAGPLSDETGNPIGSLIIVQTDDVQGARDFINADPFAFAGVFTDVQFKMFKSSISNLA